MFQESKTQIRLTSLYVLIHDWFRVYIFTTLIESPALHRNKIASCAKHFVGDGGTNKGINENNTLISENGLLRIHMAPYFDAVKKGVATIMISYSSWNGVKMHANRYLITDILKNTLNFKVCLIS